LTASSGQKSSGKNQSVQDSLICQQASKVQQNPLITLPNGAVVCPSNLLFAAYGQSCAPASGTTGGAGAKITIWNVNDNQIDKNKGCGCGGEACAIF